MSVNPFRAEKGSLDMMRLIAKRVSLVMGLCLMLLGISARAAIGEKIWISGKVKSFDKAAVLLVTGSGDVKVPRAALKKGESEQLAPGQALKVETTLVEVLKLNNVPHEVVGKLPPDACAQGADCQTQSN